MKDKNFNNQYSPLIRRNFSEDDSRKISAFVRKNYGETKGDELIRQDMFFKNCKPTSIHSRKTVLIINAKSAFERGREFAEALIAATQPKQYSQLAYAIVN